METLEENNIYLTIDETLNDIKTNKKNLKDLRKKLADLKKSIKKVNKMTLELQDIVKEKPSNKIHFTSRIKSVNKEILDFLSLPLSTTLSETNILKQFHSYIQLNNLRNDRNRYIINPDERLKKLLNLNETDELNYFNLESKLRLKNRDE